MKKLMTMIAAVATAFGLFADEPTTYNGNSFETQAEGVTDNTWSPDGEIWTSDITDPFDLGVYNTETDPKYGYPTTKVSTNTRRDTEFEGGATNLKYLKLDTGSATVDRTVADGQVFFDQVIKFTGFEDMQTNFVEGTKIALWTSAIEPEDAEGEEGTEGYVPAVPADTNLYVAVGDGQGGLVNVKVAVAPDFDFNAWHRVTIKNADKVSENYLGFFIWIDGDMATIDGGKKDYFAGDLSNLKSYYDKGQLFISMDGTSETAATVANIGFQGVGSLDDVITSATGPEFTNLTVPVTIAPLVDMTIESVKDAAGTTITADAQGKYNVAPGTTITITFAPDTGKMFKNGNKITTKITGATTINPAKEGIETADIIVTVAYDSTNEVTYADAPSAFAAVEAYTKTLGNSVEVVFNQGVTNEFYAFDQGVNIVIADDSKDDPAPAQISSYWILIGGNVAFLQGGLENNKVVTMQNGEGESSGDPIVYTLTFAGLMKDGSKITADNIVVPENSAVKLSGTASVVTKIQFAPGEIVSADAGYQVVPSEPDPETEYITYQLEEITVEYVAEINGKQYETLAAAFAAAEDNDKIVLLANAELDDWITTAKKVTLDLAGFTVSPSASFVGYPNDTLFGVKRGGVLTVDDSSVNGTGTITTGDNTTMWGCAKVTILGEAATGDPATIIVNGGNFVGRCGAICAHGVRRGGYITINGGTFSCLSEGSNVDAAIYFPAEGALTITGGSFTGKTGVYAKSGTVNITGGTFASTAASWVDYAPYNNGVNGAGAALVLEKLLPNEGGYADNLVCTVTGGTFDAPIYSFARQGSETLVGFIGSDVLVKDTITTPVEYIAPVVGKNAAWGESVEGYKKPAYSDWLKYYAEMYTNEVKIADKAAPGTDSHQYPFGAVVPCENVGVLKDETFSSGTQLEGTFYVSKLTAGETTWEFDYDAQAGKVALKADQPEGVTVDENGVIHYSFTAGKNAKIGDIYLTKYEAPAPEKPESKDADISDYNASTGAYTVTPKPGTTEVDISNGADFPGAFFEIPSSVTTIKGVEAKQIRIMSTVGSYNITDALKFSGDATTGITYELDPAAVVAKDTVNETPVTPTIQAVDTEFDIAGGTMEVKGIAGLYYSLVGSENVKTVEAGAVCDSTLATETGAKVELTDEGTKGAAKFYVIKVSINDPAAD